MALSSESWLIRRMMLSPTAQSCLLDVPPGRSEWRTERNEERNEFSFWMSGTGDPDYEESRDIEIAPRKRRELAKWLKQPPPTGRPFYEDTWRETCRTRFFHSLLCLARLESRKSMADRTLERSLTGLERGRPCGSVMALCRTACSIHA